MNEKKGSETKGRKRLYLTLDHYYPVCHSLCSADPVTLKTILIMIALPASALIAIPANLLI